MTRDSNVEQLKQRITKDVTEYIIPHLWQVEEVEDINGGMELREKAGIYGNPHHLTVLYCFIGDMEQAQARMTKVYNELKLNSQKEFFAGLVLRCKHGYSWGTVEELARSIQEICSSSFGEPFGYEECFNAAKHI
jgi:pyridoxine 5'-phosphate synthase PdxJ